MSTLTMAQTAVPRVAVVNESTKIENSLTYHITKALQLQVRRDFAPIWGTDATVVATEPADLAAHHWVLGVFDSSDQADALGYHDITPLGKPVMKVFVNDAIAAGMSLSSVASHELLETLVDPFIESLALNDAGDGTGELFGLEVADPVQADVYLIGNLPVSNFVTPWWFGDPLPAGLKYDFLGKLSGPFTIAPGGYFSSAKITKAGLQGWQQTFADKRAERLAQLSRGVKRYDALRKVSALPEKRRVCTKQFAS